MGVSYLAISQKTRWTNYLCQKTIRKEKLKHQVSKILQEKKKTKVS
jgi:hypothetical protein